MDVYLDLNQWIYLSRALHGREACPELRRVAHLADEATAKGRVRFPISRLHFIEATKIGDAARRARLAKTFIRLSCGWILRPAESIYEEELINWWRGEDPLARQAVGRGLLSTFLDYETAGRSLGVSGREVEEVDQFGDTPVAWYYALTREDYCDPGPKNRSIAERFALQVESVRLQWARLPPPQRRAIYAEGLVLDTIKSLEPLSQDSKAAIQALTSCPHEDLPTALAKIPTLDALFTLGEANVRNLSRPIAANDLWDLGFLAPAIPYCQVVVTEKYWSHLARAAGLDRKYSCKVTRSLKDLIPLLERQESR